MNQNIQDYVTTAREKGLGDPDIRQRLLDMGWDAAYVYEALDGSNELVPPRPQGPVSSNLNQGEVKVVGSGFSVSGFEYLIYFLSLGIVALAVGALLHNIVNLVVESGKFSFYGEVIPFASAALVVVGPIFIALMLRLKKKERQHPEIISDVSRRRAVQFFLFIVFLVGMAKLVAYVYNILTIGDASIYRETSVLAETLHAIITIGIAGGLFQKYFREQSNLK